MGPKKRPATALKKKPLIPKAIRTVLGWVLIVPGVVLLPTPIPVGLLMLTAGFLLLHSASPGFRQRALNVASRFPKAAQKLKIEAFLSRLHSEENSQPAKKGPRKTHGP